MRKYLTRNWFYRFANSLIISGFVMLCQPFSLTLFSIGFPVLVAGVILFIILDHLPEGLLAGEGGGND